MASGRTITDRFPKNYHTAPMKSLTAVSIVAVLALALSARAADSTVTISDVHLCCKSCVTIVEKTVGTVQGATVAVDKDAGTVALTGPDKATVQKAADALVKAGYFGKSSDASIKLDASTGAKGDKTQSLQVKGVHLCCDKCVKAVNAAVTAVLGVKETTAVKGAKSFEVTGDFNDKEVFDALQKAGLTGKVAK
jgi:periplasmic mercuric ion binding protein